MESSVAEALQPNCCSEAYNCVQDAQLLLEEDERQQRYSWAYTPLT